MRVPFQDFQEMYSDMRGELVSDFERVMNSGNFILGPEVSGFEEEFTKYVNARYCIGTASGLDALTIALESSGIPKGSEIIVPANTYIATFIAIYRAGFLPVPVDADIEAFQIDWTKIEQALTKKTGAIMPVHLYYQTPDMDKINDIAENNKILVISDAAQAHGMKYKDKTVGSTCATECFSFFPTKNIGAFGDGGAIVTNDPQILERARMLRNYGTSRKYISEIVGYNSRLDELQAAFLRSKLKKISEWNQKRNLQKNN